MTANDDASLCSSISESEAKLEEEMSMDLTTALAGSNSKRDSNVSRSKQRNSSASSGQKKVHRTSSLDETAIRAAKNRSTAKEEANCNRRSSMDHSSNKNNDSEADLDRSAVSRTLTGDLNDIVNDVARRAGRRMPRTVVPPSPTRNNRRTSPATRQVRVPRGQRVKQQQRQASKGRDLSPKSPTRLQSSDSSLSSGGNVSGLEDDDDNTSHDNHHHHGSSSNGELMNASSRSQQRGAAPGFQRRSTIDSRSNYIKMLEHKTLASFRSLNQRKVEHNKPLTYLSRLFVTFQDCLQQMNAHNVNERKLEAMAILIHECMSGDSRNYHSVQHVFEISKDFSEDDPIAVLAAMFHDCIYYNVDGRLTPLQKEVLHGCFQLNEPAGSNMTCRAHNHDCHDDEALCTTEIIFGYGDGEEITAQKGLNEFLSAVVAVRQLEGHLTKAQCAEIACCIAATIPFRNKPVEEGSKTFMEQLYDNMVKANDKLSLEMTTEQMVKAIQRAAKVANADVGNFGSDDIYYFLDNTWSLLTETNTTLRSSFLFTVMEFQLSLYKMNGFFHFLDPASIFATFQNEPPVEEVAKLTEQARKNLELGQRYVGAKLLSASVLAAFAALTGGDAPLSMFVGDLPSRHHQSQSINDALPAAGEMDEEDIEDHMDMLVYKILSIGRTSETSFDVKQSPLGAFLYAVVGDRGLKMILENKEVHPMTPDNAKGLLACLPREVTRYLAKTIAAVAVSRSNAIMDVVDNLPTKHFGPTSSTHDHVPPPTTITIVEGEELDKA